ncbi:DUF3817 domain-containing protein [Gordonia phosphorivorans]|uniref:DUF3817 domain-containing protein n=1 Tax=Gordonia phosphorivorans TaxID=1056982 RepID=A0ABV6HAI0_9ACTN
MTDTPETTTASETAETQQPRVTASAASIRTSLQRFRVLAWITGVWLLVLVAEMIAKYGFGVEGLEWIGPVHGAIYFLYFLMTLDLAMKVRWSIWKTFLTVLAGTIPLLSFWVEHIRNIEVRERFQL